jgi:biotin synthase
MAEIPEQISLCEKKILGGGLLSREEARALSKIPRQHLFNLLASADSIRNYFRGNSIQLCTIVNAKSGGCPEDCSFCAQSSKSRADIEVYPLLERNSILKNARNAKKAGAIRFSIVTSGRKVSKKDFTKIRDMISAIGDLGLLPCASLGMLNAEQLSRLKAAGLDRYHHNLETSRRFYKKICSTHEYTEKIETVKAALASGLSICSGGIFGMGETWQDRIDMAFALRRLNVDSVPINFLIPIKGTSLESRELLNPLDALQIIALYRFILPNKEIRICGGRLQVLNEFHPLIFLAGADSLLTGNYLTTFGRVPADDVGLINLCGLTLRGPS